MKGNNRLRIQGVKHFHDLLLNKLRCFAGFCDDKSIYRGDLDADIAIISTVFKRYEFGMSLL